MTSKRMLHILLITLVLSLLALAGCSRQPETRSDAQVAADVQNKLNADSSLAGRQVTINANNGTVTLSGTVENEMERAAAANAASQVEGVKTVVNDLQVGGQQAMAELPEPAPAAGAPRARRQAAARSTSAGSSGGLRRETGAAADYNAAPSAPVAPVVQRVTVPEGTQFSVRTITPVSSETASVGDTFQATLESPIYDDERVVVPSGADVEGRVVSVQSAGKFKGQSLLAVELTRLVVNGKSYQISTDDWSKTGSSRGKNTAAKVGGGAALGAIIGGIAGGGKGAAIGAAAGAGAGTGVQAITNGQQIELKPETVLNFRLQAPVSVIPASQRMR